ncbi:LWR-salt protein [Halobellus rubicundus]|uniref:LWR-salt protein n=1 Tax=Halobellus rubicundus TaxID=2996466 RepID=A0ABD5MEM9_9EURY
MRAAYVFRVTVRLRARDDVAVTPATVETVAEVEAADPGEEGWLLFRDALWRGEVNDEAHARDLAESWVAAPVERVNFSELRLDEAYRTALADAIESQPEAFGGDGPREVLHRHLGSSLRVIDG